MSFTIRHLPNIVEFKKIQNLNKKPLKIFATAAPSAPRTPNPTLNKNIINESKKYIDLLNNVKSYILKAFKNIG